MSHVSSAHHVLARIEHRLHRHSGETITCSEVRSWLTTISHELDALQTLLEGPPELTDPVVSPAVKRIRACTVCTFQQPVSASSACQMCGNRDFSPINDAPAVGEMETAADNEFNVHEPIESSATSKLFNSSGPFAEFESNTQMVTCMLELLPQDDTICSVLTCQSFRDVIYALFPSRSRPSAAAALSSLDRFLWIKTFPLEDQPSWWDADLCALIGKFGDLELLQWAKRQRCVWDSRVCTGAAKQGNLRMLQWARAQGCASDDALYAAAAASGNMEMLEWLGKPSEAEDPAVCLAAAAGGGHLELLRWLVNGGAGGWSILSDNASISGATSFLEAGGMVKGVTTLPLPCGASSVSLAGLEWMLTNGYGWCEQSSTTMPRAPKGQFIAEAAGRGELNLMQWARQHKFDWDARTCANAAGGGHMEVLQWAFDHGCPLMHKGGYTNCWRYDYEVRDEEWIDSCVSAAAGGHLDTLQWLVQNGCELSSMVTSSAAAGGHFEVLKWAIVQGCELHKEICTSAAEGGHLEFLQFIVRDLGCKLEPEACTAAAAGGHLTVLQWLRSEGCHWNDSELMVAAAGGGHLYVLHARAWRPIAGAIARRPARMAHLQPCGHRRGAGVHLRYLRFS